MPLAVLVGGTAAVVVPPVYVPPAPPLPPSAPVPANPLRGLYRPTGIDTSDARPTDGYLFPLMPQGWFSVGATARIVLSAQDTAIDGARLDVGQLRYAHTWAYAQGQDLDDLGAIVGVGRLTGEPDDGAGGGYRQRIPATVGEPNTATAPGMSSWLSRLTGLTVIATDDPAPGYASITFAGIPALGTAIVPLILARKPVGVNAQAPAATGATGSLVGGFLVGQSVVGGATGYVTLFRPAILTTSSTLVGSFVVGSQSV